MTYCDHGINHRGERHGCDGCCKAFGGNFDSMRAARDYSNALAKAKAK